MLYDIQVTRFICMSLKIRYDSNLEFMEISNDNKILFFGDYSDFKNNPIYLQAFLSQLGLDSTLEEIYL